MYGNLRIIASRYGLQSTPLRITVRKSQVRDGFHTNHKKLSYILSLKCVSRLSYGSNFDYGRTRIKMNFKMVASRGLFSEYIYKRFQWSFR